MTDTRKRCSHLTEENRTEIQNGLNMGMTFKSIARRIGADPTTISKEVKRHQVTREARSEQGKASQCPQLLKAPFVCNGCRKSNRCQMERRFYVARTAHAEYRDMLVDSRTGIVLNKEAFYEDDRALSQAIRNGQHVYHAVTSLNLHMSIPSVYRYIKKGYMSCSSMDLPRAVKFKPRYIKREPKLPKRDRELRSFMKFQEFCAENEISCWVEMDTVIGRPGGKVIMTFLFTVCNFMFGILLDDKTADSVSRAVEQLKDKLGRAGFSFGDYFPLILTDNGPEFNHISTIERSLDGLHESNLFFCEPYHSSEKPRVEKNHTLLRDILPQGTSFDDLSQVQINLVFSHVNAVARKGLHGKSAYDVFTSLFSVDFAEVLGISFVSPADVVQSPNLLKR